MSIIHQVPKIFVPPPPGGADPAGSQLNWTIDGSSNNWFTTNGTTFAEENPISVFVRGKIGQMIAFHEGGSAALEKNYTSVNGVDWINQSANPASPWELSSGFRCQTLFYLRVAGLWFAKALTGNPYFTSADGVVWVERTFPGGGTINLPEGAYMTDGVDDFILADDTLWATQDGINWNSRGTQSSCSLCVYIGTLAQPYWCVGQSFGNANVRCSTNGLNGSFSDNTPAEDSLNATDINWNDVLSIAWSYSIGRAVFGIQRTGTGLGAAIQAHSTDMVNWTENPAAARGFGLRYSATLNSFVSQSFNFTTGVLNRSVNGIDWTQTEYAAFPQNSNHHSADLLSSYGLP